PTVEVPEPKKGLRLTLFHNNDGESKLKTGDSVANYGGAGRFSARLEQLRTQARAYTDADLTAGKKEQADLLVSSGDNFLAGLALLTGFNGSGPWPDAVAASRLGYDAITLGNHEFDFGQSRLAEYIEGVDQGADFISANLNFDNVTPRLKRLVDVGRIKRSTIIQRGNQRIGVIGLTTPDIAGISSPGNVGIRSDLAAVVNEEVTSLQAKGINKIIVSAHLQGRAADFALIPLVKGVDVWIAGGGDDLFASGDDTLIPGDTPSEPYPKPVNDADGKPVQVVSTAGEYKYVGALTVEFDGDGVVKEVDGAKSGPVRVSGNVADTDLIASPAIFATDVTDPVDAFTAVQAGQIVATQTADLRRQTGGTANDPIRRREASLGNLSADAFLFAGKEAKPASTRMVAISNGGGIRADLLTTNPNGANVSKADTFGVLPFFNQTGLIENVSCTALKSLLEHAYAPLPSINGRFLHVAGMRVAINPAGTAQLPNNNGTAPIATPGTRVTDVDLVGPDGLYGTGDDIAVVDAGAVVGGCAPIDLVTTNFTAANGDFFPFTALGLTTFTSIGKLYNEALDDYLTAATVDGGLGGVIDAAKYPATVAAPQRLIIAGD
ncbi:MAG: 5'-nucleotidase C-terminal domain-containing protein, partial [Solirubrobacteraceae bacterium]|nr:5'-nucleotidase C-terminal domain-containing protein [Solirubrobacteraceae bacterium]